MICIGKTKCTSEKGLLPAHSEATERKTLLSNQEIKKFITSQQQANTVKKTACDMNVFQRFLNEWRKTKGHANLPRRAGKAAVQFSYNCKEKGQFKIKT